MGQWGFAQGLGLVVVLVLAGCKSPEERAAELEQQIADAIERGESNGTGTLAAEARKILPGFTETQHERSQKCLTAGDIHCARIWLQGCDTPKCGAALAEAAMAEYRAIGAQGIDESNTDAFFETAIVAFEGDVACALLNILIYAEQYETMGQEIPAPLVLELSTRIQGVRPNIPSDEYQATLQGYALIKTECSGVAPGVKSCVAMSSAVNKSEGHYKGVLAAMGRSTGSPMAGLQSAQARTRAGLYWILSTKLELLLPAR
jgi:hypothetical protein